MKDVPEHLRIDVLCRIGPNAPAIADDILCHYLRSPVLELNRRAMAVVAQIADFKAPLIRSLCTALEHHDRQIQLDAFVVASHSFGASDFLSHAKTRTWDLSPECEQQIRTLGLLSVPYLLSFMSSSLPHACRIFGDAATSLLEHSLDTLGTKRPAALVALFGIIPTRYEHYISMLCALLSGAVSGGISSDRHLRSTCAKALEAIAQSISAAKNNKLIPWGSNDKGPPSANRFDEVYPPDDAFSSGLLCWASWAWLNATSHAAAIDFANVAARRATEIAVPVLLAVLKHHASLDDPTDPWAATLILNVKHALKAFAALSPLVASELTTAVHQIPHSITDSLALAAVADTLVEIGDAGARVVVDAPASPGHDVRRESVESPARASAMGAASAIHFLITSLGDELLRKEATAALAKILIQAFPAMLSALTDHAAHYNPVIDYALLALFQSARNDTLRKLPEASLLQLMEDNHPSVRKCALTLLFTTPFICTAPSDVLSNALIDECLDIRLLAVELAIKRGSISVPLLMIALRDKDESVLLRAIKGLDSFREDSAAASTPLARLFGHLRWEVARDAFIAFKRIKCKSEFRE